MYDDFFRINEDDLKYNDHPGGSKTLSATDQPKSGQKPDMPWL
jgi:hypothetical protein